jgi:hypothetical protein
MSLGQWKKERVCPKRVDDYVSVIATLSICKKLQSLTAVVLAQRIVDYTTIPRRIDLLLDTRHQSRNGVIKRKWFCNLAANE